MFASAQSHDSMIAKITGGIDSVIEALLDDESATKVRKIRSSKILIDLDRKTQDSVKNS